MDESHLLIDLPPWASPWARPDEVLATDEDRMRLAIALARRNVDEEAGGPFGAAVVEQESGRVIAVGVNSVVRLNNALVHAETMALMRAQARVRRYSLSAPDLPEHTLYTSCDPCAMCLGAAFLSGVTRIVAAARREDAADLHFDEGPVFPSSYEYLARRGISVSRGLLRDEAVSVLHAYEARGGVIYGP